MAQQTLTLPSVEPDQFLIPETSNSILTLVLGIALTAFGRKSNLLTLDRKLKAQEIMDIEIDLGLPPSTILGLHICGYLEVKSDNGLPVVLFRQKGLTRIATCPLYRTGNITHLIRKKGESHALLVLPS